MTLNMNTTEYSNEELLLRRDEKRVRDQLVKQNMKLVRRIAHKLREDDEDIVSEGTIGLIKAIDRYDSTRGLKFSTYAYPYIRGAILDYFNRIEYYLPGEFSGNIRVNPYDEDSVEFIDLIPGLSNFEEDIIEEDVHTSRRRFVDKVLTEMCTKRTKSVFEMHLEGKTKNEIKTHFGVTRENIRQVILTTEKKIVNQIARKQPEL